MVGSGVSANWLIGWVGGERVINTWPSVIKTTPFRSSVRAYLVGADGVLLQGDLRVALLVGDVGRELERGALVQVVREGRHPVFMFCLGLVC